MDNDISCGIEYDGLIDFCHFCGITMHHTVSFTHTSTPTNDSSPICGLLSDEGNSDYGSVPDNDGSRWLLHWLLSMLDLRDMTSF